MSHDHVSSLSHDETRDLIERFKVTNGEHFRLADYPTGNPVPDLLRKSRSADLLRQSVERLSKRQELLYSNATWSLLLVFQAMDAAGKDSTIKHVMTGVNPQGVAVTSFKAPGPEELAHDFLWRISRALPARGMIGIFNRSHYEEVLVARVHPQILDRQRIPAPLRDGESFWRHRLDSIADFERHLARQGTRILKFFLNVGRDEQKKRFLKRLEDPAKTWKFSADDVRERASWPDYMRAYEEAIAATAADHAPWFVVPADQKWFARLVVVAAVDEALCDLGLAPPQLDPEQREAFVDARRRLEAEP